MVKFIFKGRPPSVNFMYRTARGRIYKTSPSKTFTISIREQLTNQIHQIEDFKKYENNIQVNIIFHLKTKRNIDIDNLLKVVFDCFNKSELYDDDKIIFKVIAEKKLNAKEDMFEMDVIDYGSE